LRFETTYRACSQSIMMVRIVFYFKYFFSNSLGSLGAHFCRVELPAPTWVYFPTPVKEMGASHPKTI
jgi:hypothetical protein